MGSPLAAVASSGFCASLPFIHHLMVSQLATPAPSTTSIPFCVRKHKVSASGRMEQRGKFWVGTHANNAAARAGLCNIMNLLACSGSIGKEGCKSNKGLAGNFAASI